MAVTYASNTFTITLNGSTAGTGTISGVPTTVTIGGLSQTATLITGVGTNFTSQTPVGTRIVAGGNEFIVHSITSATSMIAFLRNNTNAGTTFASTSFTFNLPTTFAQLATEAANQMVAAGSAVVQSDGRDTINFNNSALTINANAVLIADLYCSMVFGNNATNRINLNLDGVLILRNGGYIGINGPVGFQWFNGWLNVPNGTLTWNGRTLGAAGQRQDFLQSTMRSNGIANFVQISSGGAAGAWTQYVLYDNVGNPAKIGSATMINNIQTASTGASNGIYLQFENGTYNNVNFPRLTSTFNVLQSYFVYLSRTAGNTTTLRNPVFPGSSYALGFDLITGVSTQSFLINESWPDNGGVPGTLTLGATNGGGGQTHTRIFEWTPGTYFTAGGWNVRLRDSRATPVVVQNGIVTANTPLNMIWQLVTATMTTITPTNYGPFRLLARKPGFVSRYESFTPTAARTENFIPVVDATYTSDQSTRTGIAANNATNTITISSGTHTYDQLYDWFQWWMAQNAQMAAYPDVARVDSVNGSNWILPNNWTLVVNSGATLNAGTKLTYIRFGTITNNGTISASYEDNTGSFSRLTVTNLLSGMVVKLINSATGATVASTTATGTSVSLQYFIPSGQTVLNTTLYVERATGQANGYNLFTTVISLEAGGASQIAQMNVDTFYGRSAGRADRANVSVTWNALTGAPTITLSGNTDIVSVYDVVLESHATVANITYTRPTTTDGLTYQFGNANFAGTGRLTGNKQFFTTGSVTINYDLILNTLNTLNFTPNTWAKVIRTSDNSVLYAYQLNTTGRIELNLGTNVDYKIFLKRDGFRPLVQSINSGTGQVLTITQTAQSFYNSSTSISGLSFDVVRSGNVAIVRVGQMAATSQQVCAMVDVMQRDEDYADVALFANTGDILVINSQYQLTPNPTFINFQRVATLTASQFTIWDVYLTSSSGSWPDFNNTPLQSGTNQFVTTNSTATGEVAIRNDQVVAIQNGSADAVWNRVLENGKTANKSISETNNYSGLTAVEVQKVN